MLKNFLLKKNKMLSQNDGMTFIELIVIMGIFGAISATVLFNYGAFSSNVKQQNLAQDIAFQIKQAQTDAVSGRLPILFAPSEQASNQANLLPFDWRPSYGVAFSLNPNQPQDWTLGNKGFVYYFNKKPIEVGSPSRFFDDFIDSSYVSGCGAGNQAESECLDEIRITSGDYIEELCFDFSVISGESCAASGGTTADAGMASISFKRPRPNAIILKDGIDDGTAASEHSNIYIKITSPSGVSKYIAVWASGYISAE